MTVGDTDEIISIDYNSLWLKNFKFSHYKENFVIMSIENVMVLS